MKEGWKVVKIKDICEKASSNIAQKDLNDNEGEYPIYGASGFIKNVDFYQRSEPYIGIVKDGSGVGRVSLYPAYSSLLGTLQYIIPKYENDISFVYYALQSLSLSKFSVGAAIPHIYFKDYGECEIAVPPLPEQHRIVKKLDAAFEKIDAMKAKAEKNIENAKALFQQTLAEELEPKEGWVEKKLGEVCEIINGRNQKEVLADDGIYPILGSGGNVMGYANRFLCDAGTTIIGRKGSINNPIYVDEPFWNVDTAFGFCSKDEYNRKLMFYFCKSFDFSKLNKGTTLPSLVKSDLLLIDIPVPPLPEQQQIVTKLDNLSAKCKKLEEAERKTIAECDALKQAILRQAFNGEL